MKSSHKFLVIVSTLLILSSAKLPLFEIPGFFYGTKVTGLDLIDSVIKKGAPALAIAMGCAMALIYLSAIFQTYSALTVGRLQKWHTVLSFVLLTLLSLYLLLVADVRYGIAVAICGSIILLLVPSTSETKVIEEQ